MSTATAVDERVNKASPLTRIMRRPEIGALMGALVVYIFFSVADQTGTFFSLDGTARWTDVASTYGIIAIAVALLMPRMAGAALHWAGRLMLAGIVIFSGSLYLLALTGTRILGAITPFGGAAFLAAWLLVAWAALKSR